MKYPTRLGTALALLCATSAINSASAGGFGIPEYGIRRTGMAAMVGVYGPKAAARRVIQGVTNMHARVAGRTPGGEAYKALDPELLDWVSATAGDASCLNRPRLLCASQQPGFATSVAR